MAQKKPRLTEAQQVVMRDLKEKPEGALYIVQGRRAYNTMDALRRKSLIKAHYKRGDDKLYFIHWELTEEGKKYVV